MSSSVFGLCAELPTAKCKERGRTWAADWKRIRYRSLGHDRPNSLDHQNLLHDKAIKALSYPEQTRRSAALSLKLSHRHYFQKTKGNRLLCSESQSWEKPERCGHLSCFHLLNWELVLLIVAIIRLGKLLMARDCHRDILIV